MRRRRRERRWMIFAGVFGLGLIVGLYLILGSSTGRVIAETDALDPAWRLADITAARANVPDAENSALVIEAGNKLVELSSSKHADEFTQILSALAGSPAERLDEATAAKLKSALSRYQKAFPEFRKVATMPNGRELRAHTDKDTGEIEFHQILGEVVRANCLDAYERIDAGDAEGAIGRLFTCWNASHSVGDDGSTPAIMTRIECDAVTMAGIERLLAQTELSETQCAKLQEALVVEANQPLVDRWLRTQRAITFEEYEKARANQHFWSGNSQQSQVLRLFNRLIAIVHTPSATWPTQIDAWKSEALTQSGANGPASLVTSLSEFRNHDARIHSMIGALAAERHRLQHGRWPVTVKELVEAKLLTQTPVDPFDGQPLRWKRYSDCRILYSVGPNGLDDGGAINHKPSDKGADIGWHLYDPKQRRQLPPG